MKIPFSLSILVSLLGTISLSGHIITIFGEADVIVERP